MWAKIIKVMRLVSDEYIHYNISVLFTALNKMSSIDMSIMYGHHPSRYLEIKRTALNTSVSLTQNKIHTHTLHKLYLTSGSIGRFIIQYEY